MQIIIGQAEIEEAIVAYVLQMVAFNPGQQVDVEMKATRGEVGYQAFINISNVAGDARSAPRVNPPAPEKKVPSTPAEVRQMLAAEAAAEEAEEAAEEIQPEPTVEAAEEAQALVEEAPVEVEQNLEPIPPPRPATTPVVQAVQTEQVAGANTPPPKKLFGGFSKPKN
jgi:hypothetical protein